MIPTLILFGLAFGRWWRSAFIAAAIGWPMLLLAIGTTHSGPALLGAAWLAAVNTAIGVGVHQGLLRLSRRLRH